MVAPFGSAGPVGAGQLRVEFLDHSPREGTPHQRRAFDLGDAPATTTIINSSRYSRGNKAANCRLSDIVSKR
jgi:hypothetical protein